MYNLRFPNILLIAGTDGIRGRGRPRRRYLGFVECDLNSRGYEWNTYSQEITFDRLKWRKIARGMGNMGVRPKTERY